ncbi:MAG: hypothetical protein AAFU71_03820 [Cyanobacteria bacterium J06632_22]
MKFNLKTIALAVVSLSLIAGVRAAQAVPSQAVEALNLTEQQQAELDSLRAETRSQIEAILTDEQRAAVQSSLDAGEPMRQALRSLDLTEQQRSDIRTVAEGSREAGRDILTPEQQAQLEARRGERRAGRKGGIEALAEALNLTEDQKAQFETLRTNTRTEVEGVLTEEQISTFRSTLGDGDDFRAAMRSLDLSDSQRTALRGIFESSRESAQDILTEEQQQQLSEIRADRRQNRQGRRSNR